MFDSFIAWLPVFALAVVVFLIVSRRRRKRVETETKNTSVQAAIESHSQPSEPEPTAETLHVQPPIGQNRMADMAHFFFENGSRGPLDIKSSTIPFLNDKWFPVVVEAWIEAGKLYPLGIHPDLLPRCSQAVRDIHAQHLVAKELLLRDYIPNGMDRAQLHKEYPHIAPFISDAEFVAAFTPNPELEEQP